MTDTMLHKKSHNENFKNEPVKFKETLSKRIEKNRTNNLAKINKISVKSKRI